MVNSTVCKQYVNWKKKAVLFSLYQFNHLKDVIALKITHTDY